MENLEITEPYKVLNWNQPDRRARCRPMSFVYVLLAPSISPKGW